MNAPNFFKGGIVALAVALLAAVIIHRSPSSQKTSSGDAAMSSGSSSDLQGQEKIAAEASSEPGGNPPPSLPSKSFDRSATEKARQEHDIALLREQMKELENRQDEDRRSYAADLQFPDNPVKPLYENLTHQKEAMTGMKAGGLGGQHPQVMAQQQIVDSITGDVDKAIVRLGAQMKTELDAQQQMLRRQR